MMDDRNAFERQLAREVSRMAGPEPRFDALTIARSAMTTPPAARPRVITRLWSGPASPLDGGLSAPMDGGLAMFSAVKFVVAGVIVALFGGFLLAGVLTTPQGDDMAPAAVTESPSPMTTDELLAGMVTEEVEPGVFRVDHDGVRDLASIDGWLIFAGHDGSVWLEASGDFVRLGDVQTHDPRVDESEVLTDLEVALDGTVWAAIVAEDGGGSLRSFDGEAWTIHSVVEPSGHDNSWPFVEVTPTGGVWAVSTAGVIGYLEADGSTWLTIETPDFWSGIHVMAFRATDSDVLVPQWKGLWHYADGVWEEIPYGDPDTGAMPDGVFWALGEGNSGSHEILHRHDGTGWRRWTLEEQGMAPFWGTTPYFYRTAPDGSFWAGWTVNVSDGVRNEPRCDGVSRFDGLTWTRYLAGTCVGRLDVAPDGSVWLLATEGDGGEPDLEPPYSLYVITPEAVTATE